MPARGGATPDPSLSEMDLATLPRPQVLSRRRTLDGWVRDRRSRRDEWAGWLSDLPAFSSPQSCGGRLDTASPYPSPPWTAHVECVRDVPPPPAPLGAWSGASLPSTTGPSDPCATGRLGCSVGPEFLGACALLGLPFLPRCHGPSKNLLNTLPVSLSGQELLDRHRVLGFPG